MTTNGPVSVPNLRFRQALDAVRDELASIPHDELLHINLEIPTATMTALGSTPQMRAFRARIVEELPKFDLVTYDKLETYALATGQAHAQYLAASAPAEPIQELYDELSKLRELLVSDVTALAKRKLVDGERLAQLQGPNGFKNVAFDVLLLCAMLRDHWPQLAGRTGVQIAELDRAEMLADRLATAVALRDRGGAATTEAAELRQRAFTRFVTAYDQARRAITYVRWTEDDADTIIPSLFGGKKRKSAADKADKPGEATATPAHAVATPAAQPAANAPSAPADAHATGMPGDEPFSP
jgi:hypothetical protein